MTESQVGFLYKAASSLRHAEQNEFVTLLRSYYLMRCKDLTKGYGLPEKHFSPKARCSKCSLEWTKTAMTKVKAIKLSKKQRRRIRSQKANKNNKNDFAKKELLNSNQIEQICSFCKQITVTTALKPERVKTLNSLVNNNKIVNHNDKIIIKHEPSKKESQGLIALNSKKTDSIKGSKLEKKSKKKEINVYSNTTEIFSLYNKNNAIVNHMKDEQKVVKINKKKKDKFAGLCQKAVLATAKLKEEKEKQNKLNLFLKPSI